MDEEVDRVFQKLLKKNGLKFYIKSSVDLAIASQNDLNTIDVAKLKNSKSLKTDLIILDIGIVSTIKYLKDDNAINLEKNGLLHVDENFQVQDLKDIFTTYHDPDGNDTYSD